MSKQENPTIGKYTEIDHKVLCDLREIEPEPFYFCVRCGCDLNHNVDLCLHCEGA